MIISYNVVFTDSQRQIKATIQKQIVLYMLNTFFVLFLKTKTKQTKEQLNTELSNSTWTADNVTSGKLEVVQIN